MLNDILRNKLFLVLVLVIICEFSLRSQSYADLLKITASGTGLNKFDSTKSASSLTEYGADLTAPVMLNDKNNFLTEAQMKGRGITQGLPFLAHGGMWGDFFIISPIVFCIVCTYSCLWRPEQILFSVIVGIIASAILHHFYLLIETPESHVENGYLTLSGWIHFLYVIVVFSVLVLFYFFTPGMQYTHFIVASIFIIFHVLVSNHLILEIIQPRWYGKSHFKDSLFILTFVTLVAVLAWRCYLIFV